MIVSGTNDAYLESLPKAKRDRQARGFAAPKYNIDLALVLAIASTESNFDPAAASPKSALRGDAAETAERFNVKDA